jgi:hypothetical protein
LIFTFTIIIIASLFFLLTVLNKNALLIIKKFVCFCITISYFLLQLFAEAAIKTAENDSQRLLLEEKRLEIEEKRITIEGQIHKVLTILLDKIE